MHFNSYLTDLGYSFYGIIKEESRFRDSSSNLCLYEYAIILYYLYSKCNREIRNKESGVVVRRIKIIGRRIFLYLYSAVKPHPSSGFAALRLA